MKQLPSQNWTARKVLLRRNFPRQINCRKSFTKCRLQLICLIVEKDRYMLAIDRDQNPPSFIKLHLIQEIRSHCSWNKKVPFPPVRYVRTMLAYCLEFDSKQWWQSKVTLVQMWHEHINLLRPHKIGVRSEGQRPMTSEAICSWIADRMIAKAE